MITLLKIDLVRKYLFLILFFAVFLRVYAQKELKVLIVDKETNEPIPFASLSYFYSNNCKGLYSGADGLIKVNLPNNIDSLKIACLGYLPIIRSRIRMDDTIKLERDTYILKEVLIHPFNKPDFQTIGFANMSSKTEFTSYSGVECVVFINNEGKEELFIKSVLYKMKIRGQLNSVIRIHLYTCDGNCMPDRELINENYIVYLSKKNDGLIEVDISKFNIKLPLNGIYVGLEWIGNLDEKTNRIIEDRGIVKVKYIGNESFIKLISSNIRQQTYLRCLNDKKNWDNSMFLNLPHNESLKLNAAFGLKLLKD